MLLARIFFIVLIIMIGSVSKITANEHPFVDTLHNIVVFVSFADQDEFKTSLTFMENFMNQTKDVSVQDYYHEVSGGKLTIKSHFYPKPVDGNIISYKSEHPMSYFQPYSVSNPNGYTNDNSYSREQNLCYNAISSIVEQVEADGLNL